MYTPVREPSQWELDNIPRIILTGDQPWDPGLINDDLEGQLMYPDDDDAEDDMFQYLRQVNDLQTSSEAIPEVEACAILDYISGRVLAPTTTVDSTQDYSAYQKFLGWLPLDRVKATLKCMMQMATNWVKLPLQCHFKSRFPQLNHEWIRETYATDTFFSSIKGIGGENCAQLYVRTESLFTKVYGMATESQ